MDNATLSKLTTFLSSHRNIEHTSPSSPSFSSQSAVFTNPPKATPSAILRPSTAEDVAAVIRFLSVNAIDFTVRSGGHDMWARGIKSNAVTLDMRSLNHVELDGTSMTAQIGGGALQGDVVSMLQKDGYITPVGTIATVGYVGWAMYGGYGPYSPLFGLGVDQIIGAKVVDGHGEIVKADKELLKAIKGGGGAFGVVVEVIVTVYKLDKIFAGAVLYNSEDLRSTITQYSCGYQSLKTEGDGIPAQLSLQQSVIKVPRPTFAVLFVWASSDMETGKHWLEKISGLAPVVGTAVQLTTPTAWLEDAAKFVPATTHGGVYTINIKKVTNEVAEIMADYALNIPTDPHAFWGMHELRGGTVSAQEKHDSVFAAREGHFLFEILAIAEKKDNLDAIFAWGAKFQQALLGTEKRNIVPASYLSFLRKEEVDHGKVFGKDLEFLRRVKERADPKGAFANAISYL
ncbi:FAD-binding domain-containing protein [Aspergillus pseudoustus]|uniref:FAD-binding domain-containing protein n=1 Tax=Aspergillus pseudoustus TaxID=1810923 RepID=A0ABR4J9Q9_9EURO